MFTWKRRIAVLEAELDRLRREIEPEPEQSATLPSSNDPVETAELRSSRRALFKAGAAAAVAVAATPLLAGTADATDNAALIVGVTNSSAGGKTRVQADISGGALTDNVFSAADGGSGSQFPSALGGFAFNNRVSNGVYAFSGGRTDATQGTGHAFIARPSSASRSHLYMIPIAGDPRSDTFVHGAGEFRVDQTGQLWYCVQSGTPGLWRRIAGVTTGGALHPIQPTRVWDSRLGFGGGIMTDLQSRVISVADGRDLFSGAVTQANVVPSGATAVMFNLAVVSASTAGYLSVTPGDASAFTAASINWSSANQILNNGTMSTLNASRQLKVWCSGSTHFIVDITGYML